jgi:uncharacterized protein YdhG (YjbR/CyaY superfamily)
MEDKKNRPTSIDEYITQFPAEVQAVMQELRQVIRQAAPQAKERISYGMPGFYDHGMLVWFGGHMSHLGFYPTGEGIAAFKDELSGYKMSKGAVQFPLDQPIPYDLVKKIVKHRLEENLKKNNLASR